MALKFKKVRYNHSYYAVVNIKYKTLNVPIILNWDDFRVISSLGKDWKSNKFGFVSCIHNYKGVQKEVFIHEIVMALKQKSLNKKPLKKAIMHINRIGWDNRRDNLQYDVPKKDKTVYKNIKKKKRTIDLQDTGVNVDDLPTYVWYMKPDKTHGERFLVDIAGEYQWKTTSSKKLSLRYKLEEAKKYLREIKKKRPDLFETHSMNGDFNKDGKQLIDTFYTIVGRAGYKNISNIPLINNNSNSNTDRLLKQNNNKKDRQLLEDLIFNTQDIQDIEDTQDTQYTQDTKYTKDTNKKKVKLNRLPKYVYYRPESNVRGDQFTVQNHPKQPSDKKLWQTTSSKKVSLNDKYEELLRYLTNL